jgi:hypothetical protein
MVLEGKLLIYGGLGYNEMHYNDMWILHIDDLKWQQCRVKETSHPPYLYDHILIRIGKRAISFGGLQRMDQCVNSVSLISVSESNLVKYHSIKGSPCPTARYGHSLNCVNGNLFVIGGKNHSGICADIWIGDIGKSSYSSSSS